MPCGGLPWTRHRLVLHSPLGRGLVTGAHTSADELFADDFRRTQPRWQAGNLATNLELVNQFCSIATDTTPLHRRWR